MSVTPVSDQKLDVKFSEKVTPGTAAALANYGIVLKGTAYSAAISGITQIDDTTYRVATTVALTEGSVYSLSVNKISDASTNANTMANVQTLDFTAIKDTTRPTLTSVVALDTNKVEVTMSEELDKAATLPTVVITPYKADGTLDTLNAYTAVIPASDLSGNKVTVNITNNANLLINSKNYKLEISGAKDLSGNVIADGQTLGFVGVSDVVAPTVKSNSYDAKTGKLTIAFSEKMVGLNNPASYAVFDTVTGLIQPALIAPVANADANEVVLTITGLAENKSYSLRINGLADASKASNPLQANTLISFAIPQTIVDVKLNTAVPGAAGNTLVLTFNTNLTKADAENINNYKIVNKADETKTLAITKAVYDDANKTVTLTTNYQAQNADATDNYVVYVSNLANLNNDYASKSFAGVDKVAATLQTIKPISQNYIDLNFDENINATQDTLDITIIKTGTAEVVGSLSGTNINIASISNKTMRLNLANNLVDGSNYTITVKGVKDVFGNYMTNDTTPVVKSVSTTFNAVKDLTAPQLKGITVVNSAKLVLQFDEEVTNAGALANYAVTDANGNVVNFAANSTFTINPDDNTQVIIENKDANGLVDLLDNAKNYTLKITGGVADVAGNTVQTESLGFVGVKDAVSPKLLSASASPVKVTDGIYNTKVVLTFDEAIKPDLTATTFNTSDFVVTDTANFNTLNVTAAKLGTDNKTIELTLSTPTSTSGQYKVYVQGNITDLAVAGNVIDSNYRIALFSGVDTQAPTLTDMQLSGSLSDGTVVAAPTIAVGSLDATNHGTITISGLTANAKYTTGSVKISENVGITFDAINNDFDVTTPVQISKDTNAQTLTSIVLTVLGGVDGASTSQLTSENGATITLKDAVGNASTYTIQIQ